MKISQKSKRRAMLAILLLTFAGVAFFALYIAQDRALGKTEANPPMKGAPGMEGMKMGVNETGRATATLTPEEERRIGVKVAEVREKEVEKVVRTVGRVAYDEQKLARINLRVDGWIQDLLVNFTGQEVRKEEPLLTLYSPDLLSTQQEYLLAKRGREKLSASPIAEVRETGGALLSSARRRLLLSGMTEKQIQELEERGSPQTAVAIASPISGVVIRREGTRGMRVTPETTLYEIADLSTVWVLAEVYESDFSDLKEGQEAKVAVDAYPGETFHGKVAYIDPFLDPQTRTVRARLELPNPGLKLKPEMFARVELTSRIGKGLLIPESAVLDSGTRRIVFVEKGMGMYEPREIKARRINAEYWVQEGLIAGERIVTSANFLIDSESKLMASANRMGALGMAGVKMEQAEMGRMDMPGMGMKGEHSSKGPQTQKAGRLTLSTEPAPPKEGENLLRLKIADASGNPVENAKVLFSYVMPMPGMKAAKKPAGFKDGWYEAKVNFGMAGTWEVTALITPPGEPEVREKFTLEAVGGEEGGMEGMPGM